MTRINAANVKNLLLVEGEADRGLFEQLCKTLPDPVNIMVATPKDIEPLSRNSKQGVFNQLNILTKGLSEDREKRLAVVVDADYVDEGGLGIQGTLDQFSIKLQNFGYSLAPENASNGFTFQHTDGLPAIGLWIMPDNASEGMLEDWLKSCIHTDEHDLFNRAETVVSSIEAPKFKSIHQTKAEVATWLAWQKNPGHGLYGAIKDQLLDRNNQRYVDLGAWLSRIYA